MLGDALRTLCAQLPVRYALLADGSGIFVSSQVELPETLAPWFDGLAYDDRLSEKEGSSCLTTETGGIVCSRGSRRRCSCSSFLIVEPNRDRSAPPCYPR